MNANPVLDPLADCSPRPVPEYGSEFDFHSAMDFEETKDHVVCSECFITHLIVEKLLELTNRRAEIYFQAENAYTSFSLKWKDEALKEIFTFISLNLLTGLEKCLQISDYLSTELCSGRNVIH
ncbi:hypothetical protein HHI36_008947 [Cryptolaemus montrouzieri]|uniref:Uncharacterized protein n=1 Tax=Cryptolaemus montrouzieri TaxID=559131 RepID=A0ABD2MUG1_9CUCU